MNTLRAAARFTHQPSGHFRVKRGNLKDDPVNFPGFVQCMPGHGQFVERVGIHRLQFGGDLEGFNGFQSVAEPAVDHAEAEPGAVKAAPDGNGSLEAADRFVVPVLLLADIAQIEVELCVFRFNVEGLLEKSGCTVPMLTGSFLKTCGGGGERKLRVCGKRCPECYKGIVMAVQGKQQLCTMVMQPVQHECQGSPDRAKDAQADDILAI